jgi:hypothetical protein
VVARPPPPELNFPDVESIKEVEVLVPPFHIMSRTEELQMRWDYLQLRTREADDTAMAAFHATHL